MIILRIISNANIAKIGEISNPFILEGGKI
jgi:hypothetical protein